MTPLKEAKDEMDSLPQRLEKLKGMLDQGVIAHDEYEAMRKKALGL